MGRERAEARPLEKSEHPVTQNLTSLGRPLPPFSFGLLHPSFVHSVVYILSYTALRKREVAIFRIDFSILRSSLSFSLPVFSYILSLFFYPPPSFIFFEIILKKFFFFVQSCLAVLLAVKKFCRMANATVWFSYTTLNFLKFFIKYFKWY